MFRSKMRAFSVETSVGPEDRVPRTCRRRTLIFGPWRLALDVDSFVEGDLHGSVEGFTSVVLCLFAKVRVFCIIMVQLSRFNLNCFHFSILCLRRGSLRTYSVASYLRLCVHLRITSHAQYCILFVTLCAFADHFLLTLCALTDNFARAMLYLIGDSVCIRGSLFTDSVCTYG